MSVEVDPENAKNLIFSFRNAHLAQKVRQPPALFYNVSLSLSLSDLSRRPNMGRHSTESR